MSPAEFGVNFFIALFALLDPIGNVPMFAAATLGATTRGRNLVAFYIAIFALAFLTFFYFSGIALLQFFGISLPAFRIAGGILLLLLGLDMAREDLNTAFSGGDVTGIDPKDARGYARRRFEGMVVPFAMPLLIGPGAISTVIIYATEAKDFGLVGAGVGFATIAAVCIAVLLCFWLTPLMSRVFGKIGMTIVVRVAGLILCAMAVQFIITGLGDTTSGLVKKSVSAPYASDKAH